MYSKHPHFCYMIRAGMLPDCFRSTQNSAFHFDKYQTAALFTNQQSAPLSWKLLHIKSTQFITTLCRGYTLDARAIRWNKILVYTSAVFALLFPEDHLSVKLCGFLGKISIQLVCCSWCSFLAQAAYLVLPWLTPSWPLCRYESSVKDRHRVRWRGRLYVCLHCMRFTLSLPSQWGKPSRAGSSHFSWAPFRRSGQRQGREREKINKVKSVGCKIL